MIGFNFGVVASQRAVSEVPTIQIIVNDATQGTGQLQNNYNIINPGSNWTVASAKATAYNGNQSFTNTTDDYVEITFTGTKVEWISEYFPWHGIAEISIDGVVMGTVDQYGAELTQQVLYTSPTLSDGVHVIRIRNTGLANPLNTNGTHYLVHDYFKVYSTSVVVSGNWYVGGPGASNSNPGNTINAPFATIQAALNVATPGHTVIVREGIYRETIIPVNNGTSANPITIKAQPGENAIISGLNTIDDTGWTVHSGNIYKKTITLPVTGYAATLTTNTSLLANQIFKDGEMMIEARWPKLNNIDDSFIQTNGRKFLLPADFGATSLTDSALSSVVAAPGLVGATMIATGWFIASSRTITAHSGNTISFSNIWGENYRARRNYYVTGKLALLTQAKEWHYEGNTLYFWQQGGGSPTSLEYKARNWGFDLRGKSYINIAGLQFKGCEPVMGNDSTNNITIDNIKATYTNHNVRHDTERWQGVGMTRQMGIGLRGSNNTIKNSDISYCASGAVWIGVGGRVENCNIHHVGYDASFCYCVDLWGEDNVDNTTITKNTFHTVSRGGVGCGYMFTEFDHRRARNMDISYNNMYNWGILNQDGGAIYCWGYQDHSGSRVHHNWFHDAGFMPNPLGQTLDGIQVAFYTDQGAGPFTVDHNVFWNNCENLSQDCADVYTQPTFQGGAGGFRNNGGSKFYNNTFWSNPGSGWTYKANNGPKEPFRNCIVRRNFTFVPSSVGPVDQANCILTGTNPLFVGGSIATPQNYFQLAPGSPGLNTGQVIAGITDGSNGTPDIGAYENGVTPWVPGHTVVPYTG